VKLNDEQRQIVDEPIDAPVKATAVAGTGKTRVLVERYLKFVFEDGIDPDNLLALTFTKKAAAEMHGRIFGRVVTRGDKQILRALYGAWIMNFHQFAFRVIKENAASFGIDPDTGVASQVDLARLRRRLKKRFEAGTMDGLPEGYEEDMPLPNRMDRYFEKVMDIVNKARGTLWTPESLLGTVRADDLPAYQRYVDTVVAVWRAYEHDLHSRLLLDFPDLIRIVVDEFSRNDTLRAQYVRRFRHILVDEYQDTSEAQNELLRLLSGGDFSSVTVVGDEKQSIYRWRDARVENIRGFVGKELLLNTNYRSTQGILDLAFHVLTEDPYFEKRAEEIRLRADRGGSEVPVCVFHPRDGSDASPAEEAKALGAWILAITGRLQAGAAAPEYYERQSPKLGFGDIAVLMRSLKPSSGLPHYERELNRLRIPYAIMGGVSALDELVLELFKNLLNLLVYPKNVRALLSVIEAEPFAIPDKSINELLRGVGKSFDVSYVLSEAKVGQVTDPVARDRLTTLRRALEELEHRRSQVDLAAFVTDAMEYTQFLYQLFSEGADLRVVDSISKRVWELIEQLFQRNEANLAAFLEAIQTLLDDKQFSEEDAPYVPEGRVVIMTQHQAKGLEFKAVAIPGIKRLSGKREGFYLVKGQGLYTSDGEKWNRGTKNSDVAEREKVERTQEERCLLYVAMTRAEDHLFLSSPFANGIERKKKTFFAPVIRALREHDIPHEEWREIAGIARAADTDDADGTERTVDLSQLIDEWDADRERIQDSRAVTIPAPQGLQFVSWRGLYAFGQCPLRYYYRYVAGIHDDLLAQRVDGADEEDEAGDVDPTTIPKGMTPAEFGGFVHRFFYEWLSGGDPTNESARESLRGLAQRYRVKDAARTQAVDLALDLAKSYRDEMPWTRDDIHKLEWPVQVRLGNTVFHGVVDRIDRDNDGLQVYDYKIGKPLDNRRRLPSMWEIVRSSGSSRMPNDSMK
jgi:DNA helicase-2/ATP-dependent DNA helicase PcrA